MCAFLCYAVYRGNDKHACYGAKNILVYRSVHLQTYHMESTIETGEKMNKEEVRLLFDPKHILWVGQMRDRFFSTGSAEGITGVRREILYGWDMTYRQGFRDTYFPKPVAGDLAARQKRHAVLLDIAQPYMEKLYRFLANDSFWITLMDADGVILRLVGAPGMLSELAATGLQEGSDRGKNAPYCGLFHLVYTYSKPFILSATEHASAIDDNLAGAACPIFEHHTRRILGFIAVSGHWWDSHLHTLGLAVVTAEAISKQVALQAIGRRMHAASQEIKQVNRLLQATVDSVEEGLIYCDETGRIKMANQQAACLLHLPSADMLAGRSVFSYIDLSVSLKHIKQYTAHSRPFSCSIQLGGQTGGGKNVSVYCSVRPIWDGDGYVVSLAKQTDTHRKAARIAYSKPVFLFDSIIGKDKSILALKEKAICVAAYDAAVLITGESGTGKEMVAQAIHNASRRAGGPFIAINCGAIPRTRIEAELFGYEKGAFTGADKNGHPGKFELAHGGTLFLDEIGDMPYDVQVSILRVLQTREIMRIGGTKPIKIDVRIISATNKDLQESMDKLLFRRDLFYRLNVFPLSIPPLRERGKDILILAAHFISIYNSIYHKSITGLSPEVQQVFGDYAWPGNIRELQNMIESAMILCRHEEITLDDLPGFVSRPVSRIADYGGDEREALLRALREAAGNLTEAAKLLGISRPTLYKRIRKYHIR